MTPIFKLVARNTIENLIPTINDFKTLFEGWRSSLDVSTSDQEKTIRICLDVLEVVLKFVCYIHGTFSYVFVSNRIHVNHFRVSLKNVNFFETFS